MLTAPAWLLFYQGKEVERMARFIPQAQMKQTLAKWTKVAEAASVTGLSMFHDGCGLDNDASGQVFKMICKTLKILTALFTKRPSETACRLR